MELVHDRHPDRHPDQAPTSRSDRSGWRLTWASGPDAGQRHHLSAGRWLVGRAPAAHVRCDDPALEPFHVELRLWPHGECQVVQLAGRSPVRRDGDHLRLGSSTLLVEHVEELPDPSAVEPLDRRVRRRPRAVPAFVPAPLIAPAPLEAGAAEGGSSSGSTALVSSGVAFGGALLVGAITHQVLFAVLAGVAAVASAVTWAVGQWSSRRRRTRRVRAHHAALHRHRDEVGARVSAAAAHRRSVTATLCDAHLAVAIGGDRLWQRRPQHADAFEVAVGEGDLPWPASTMGVGADRSTEHAGAADGSGLFDEGGLHVLRGVPVTLSLGPGRRVLVAGPGAVTAARSLVVQLATQCGPADWHLALAGDGAARWRWAGGLPHARASAGPPVLDDRSLLDLATGTAAGDDDPSAPHTLLVVDGAAPLTVRTSALRRCPAGHERWALLVIDDDPAAVPPPGCTAVVVTTADGGARLIADPSAASAPVEVRVAGVSERTAAALARRLATWTDPEAASGAGSVPAVVGWEALAAEAGVDVTDPASVAAAWHVAVAARASIGRAGDGAVDVDLVRDGPHALLAGTTGAGKSELLRALVLGLAVALPPDRLRVVLVDFKGGAAFDVLVDLPHVAGLVTDLEPAAVDRVLRSLRAELTVREAVLRDLGVADVVDVADPTVLPRLLVVVDEFAALATDHPEVLHALVGIARRGRSLGVHLVLATQRPAGVISDEIRANTNLRLALRLHDRADAIDVVGDAAPSGFHRSVPGRCALRLGPDELVVFQTAHVRDPAAAVATVRAAAERSGIVVGPPLWCDPLPSAVAVEDVPAGALGLVDDVDGRTRTPLRWCPSDGHLLVAGRAGSGVTTTLQRVAWHAAADPVTVLVIDPFGSPAWATMATHPRCAAVVHPDDRELLQRLLRTALDTPIAPPIDTATHSADGPSRLLVVIDGLGVVRRHLDGVTRAGDLDLLDRLLAAAPPGVTLLVGVDGPAGLSATVLGRFACRWVHHLHDAHDASMFGVAIADRVPPVPGRVHVGGGRHAQVAVGPLPPSPAGRAVARLGHVPARIDADALPDTRWADGAWHAPIGLAAGRMQPIELRVPDGEHVLVAGPARSGRSGALVRLAVSFSAAAADARVIVMAPRRSPLRHLDDARESIETQLEPALDLVEELVGRGVPVLLAIDDAELVADPSGRLASLIAGRTPGLVVAAAARPEALRQAYGHWTGALRRSGLGLLMSGADELAGDLLGVTLPRHPPIGPRPGLAWVVADGTCELAQVACDPRPVGARIVTR